jgi:uncharacterized DUF497 family protein
MKDIVFEWDKLKERRNQKKHGVSFEEAATVFVDEKALLIQDPDHSDEEDRFLLLGLSSNLRILLVCHCYRQSDRIIRLISARKASQSEQQQYWERWKA